MTDERTRIEDVADRWFRGARPEEITAATGFSLEIVTDVIARLEAVTVLLANEFPAHLIDRAARLKTDEAYSAIEAVQRLAKTPEQLHALAAKHGLNSGARAVSPPLESLPASDPGEEAAQALDVLDFWASKWL